MLIAECWDAELRFEAVGHKIEVVLVADSPVTPRAASSAIQFTGRDGRVAEGARLESVFTRKGNVGSNPTLSAITHLPA